MSMEINKLLKMASKLKVDYPKVYQWCCDKAAWEHMTIGEVLANYKDYIDEQIAKEKIMNEWISVKDKLPLTLPCVPGSDAEYSEAVIVITEDRIAVTAVWNGKEWIGDFDYWEATEPVTHWMPLPKLPTPNCTIS